MYKRPSRTSCRAPTNTSVPNTSVPDTSVPKKSVLKKSVLKKSASNRKVNSSDDKKRKTERTESYSIYIHRVLKQFHPDFSICNESISIIDSIIDEMFELIASKAAKLAVEKKRSTINSKDIQASIPLIMSGELGKCAISEGTKAVTKYFSSP
ncbi:histone-fold-containing protein [Phascolomyces articulosus]|uniref:Histone-fold-containing protein n=1 Tax=Phascolomyces articulosus TaxID=60185 RepID=A0AAD5PDM6_9FUNG|nr:histone-fold-containing protein [Phascolomyces articulosus]